MGESLTQRHRVPEEALRGVNGFSGGGSQLLLVDSTPGIRDDQLRASSRGKTKVPSVTRIHWA